MHSKLWKWIKIIRKILPDTERLDAVQMLKLKAGG